MRLRFYLSRQPTAARVRQLVPCAQPSCFSGHGAVTLTRYAAFARALRAQFGRDLLLDLVPRSDMGRAMRESAAHVGDKAASYGRIVLAHARPDSIPAPTLARPRFAASRYYLSAVLKIIIT